MNKNKRGQKYFKRIDGELFTIRIGRVKGNEYSAKVIGKVNDYIKVTEEELVKDYTLLNPDGYITFSIVNLADAVQDVIICLHRKEDMAQGSLPYAICRQSVQDIFSQITNKNERVMYIGCSVSQDTCPKDVDFRAMTSCNTVETMDSVAIYIGDTFNSFMSLINRKKYDSVLNISLDKSLKGYKDMCDRAVVERLMPPLKPIGFVNTLEELLMINNFMYDFYKAFDITIAHFEMSEDMFTKDNIQINVHLAKYFENIVKHDIINFMLAPYSKEIDLSSIQRGFMLVVDINEKIWVLGYDIAEHDSRTVYETIEQRDIYASMTNRRIYGINK